MAPGGAKSSGSKHNEFKIGDRVFAKVRGWPAWPARVDGLVEKGKVAVFFYGTHDTCYLHTRDLVLYTEESKDKFARETKRRGFNEGLWEIECDPNVLKEEVRSALSQGNLPKPGIPAGASSSEASGPQVSTSNVSDSARASVTASSSENGADADLPLAALATASKDAQTVPRLRIKIPTPSSSSTSRSPSSVQTRSSSSASSNEQPQPAEKKRGRPRRSEPAHNTTQQTRGKRGRPKSVPPPEELMKSESNSSDEKALSMHRSISAATTEKETDDKNSSLSSAYDEIDNKDSAETAKLAEAPITPVEDSEKTTRRNRGRPKKSGSEETPKEDSVVSKRPRRSLARNRKISDESNDEKVEENLTEITDKVIETSESKEETEKPENGDEETLEPKPKRQKRHSVQVAVPSSSSDSSSEEEIIVRSSKRKERPLLEESKESDIRTDEDSTSLPKEIETSDGGEPNEVEEVSTPVPSDNGVGITPANKKSKHRSKDKNVQKQETVTSIQLPKKDEIETLNELATVGEKLQKLEVGIKQSLTVDVFGKINSTRYSRLMDFAMTLPFKFDVVKANQSFVDVIKKAKNFKSNEEISRKAQDFMEYLRKQLAATQISAKKPVQKTSSLATITKSLPTTPLVTTPITPTTSETTQEEETVPTGSERPTFPPPRPPQTNLSSTSSPAINDNVQKSSSQSPASLTSPTPVSNPEISTSSPMETETVKEEEPEIDTEKRLKELLSGVKVAPILPPTTPVEQRSNERDIDDETLHSMLGVD